jgi:hypothetical protein
MDAKLICQTDGVALTHAHPGCHCGLCSFLRVLAPAQILGGARPTGRKARGGARLTRPPASSIATRRTTSSPDGITGNTATRSTSSSPGRQRGPVEDLELRPVRGPRRRSSSAHSVVGEVCSPGEDQLARLCGHAEYLQLARPTMHSGGARPGDGAPPWRTLSSPDWWRGPWRRSSSTHSTAGEIHNPAED